MKKIAIIAFSMFSVLCSVLQLHAQKSPNIVFILADDLGYGDVSCLNENGKVPTPQIDKFATQSVVFTDAHSSSAVCTPTRYGILTGRYNWRSNLKEGVLGGYSEALIPNDRTTMASMLKENGYQTACIGKWHLGWTWAGIENGFNNIDYSKPIQNGPTTVGFDYFYGIPASLDMTPYVYIENDIPTTVPDRMTKGKNRQLGDPDYEGKFWRKGLAGSDFKHEEVLPNLVGKAVDYIKKEAKKENPYFLYLALPAPHTPSLPSEKFRGKSGINTYADFVMNVDDEVGRVIKAIKESGEEDNTIVVFTSDNGCSPAADFETLIAHGHNPSYIFRGNKADLFDGGHRIPCIVRWPAKFESHRVDKTICLTDFMATFASVSGYKLRDNQGEDSFNLLPLLNGKMPENYKREATVSHSINGSFTIRQGDWKLLFAPSSGGWSFPRPGKDDEVIKTLPEYQLYNLKNDPGETNNIYSQHQEVVKNLKSLIEKYIEDGRSTPGKKQENDGEKVALDYWKNKK